MNGKRKASSKFGGFIHDDMEQTIDLHVYQSTTYSFKVQFFFERKVMKMNEEKTKRYTTFVRGKEVELSKEQHVMKRRFRQRDEYHQRFKKPKEYSLEQAAEELIPIEYRKIREMKSLEEEVLIKIEVEWILNLIKARSESDYLLIIDLYINDLTEAEVARKMGTSQQNVHARKKRIIRWIRDKEEC